MSYQIIINKKALKAMEKINEPDCAAIKTAIYCLAETPRPYGYKKLKGGAGYRIRVGNYRIIYAIFDKVLLVDIILQTG